MLAVLLPPIWSPAIYQRLGNDGELTFRGGGNFATAHFGHGVDVKASVRPQADPPAE